MIEVTEITKDFGRVTAVAGLSFSVAKGEVLGFLGPNGAGKTTTMRILTGYIPATKGSAVVAGHDVRREPLEAKRKIGYLPESPPLYPEMTVESYLDFVARIKEVPRTQRRAKLGEAIERCALSEVRDKLTGKLSKGYRQRVGLAQALLHDPEVLILDEPTAGLDPKQINETRALIRSLGGDHTVVLSTHILPE
ncbi:MAG: ABC transporter ATP-binding protein, partial [Vicinamibacteria bacterium]